MPTTLTLDPDPGNVFPSNLHRRVAAYLPTPEEEAITTENLFHRILPDPETAVDAPTLETVLDELYGEGDLEKIEGAYRQSTLGHERLTGPAYVRREIPDGKGGIEIELEEPVPKEGNDLKRAEEVNAERAEEDRQIEEENKERRIEELQEQIADLKGEN